jgi:hypothetical protein
VLNWVKTGPLDFHFASESKRKDPERFFRRSSKEFVLYNKDQHSVNLSDGTSITFDGFKYLHLDKNGKILHVVKKGERPSSGFWGGVSMALNFFTATHDLKGEIIHPKYPLSLQQSMTDKQTKAKKRMDDEFYKRQRKP